MSRLLALITIVLGIISVQPTSTPSSEKNALTKVTKRTRTPARPISEAKQFAPSKNETRIDTLLTTKSVQRELKLTDKQAKNLDLIMGSQFERHLPLLEEYRNNTHNPEKRAEIGSQLGNLFNEFAKEIKGQLSKDQYRRLIQISAQNAGMAALLLPEIADAINLSPDRQVAVKEILDAMNLKKEQMEKELRVTDVQQIAIFPGGNWDEFRKSKPYLERHERYERAIEANRVQGRRDISRLLTRNQQQKFNEFLGEPFDPEKLREPEDDKKKDEQTTKNH